MSSGTPEYILVQAGLFRVADHGVLPTDSLTRLIDPAPDALLPVLIDMAEICAVELGGAIETNGRRMSVVSLLQELGLAHEAIGDLFKLVSQAAAATAEERRRWPKLRPL